MSNVESALTSIAAQIAALSGKVDDAAAKRRADSARLDSIESRLAHVEEATDYGLFRWLGRHWKIVAVLSGMAPFTLSLLAAGFWTLNGDSIVEFIRVELDRSATRADTRILHQPLGYSYIEQPVVQGDTAVYNLWAARTVFGARCTYINTVPVFRDESGIARSGDFESRGRQYSNALERAQFELQLPPELEPGRVLVVLQLTYRCAGEVMTEETYPVSFQLLPAEARP